MQINELLEGIVEAGAKKKIYQGVNLYILVRSSWTRTIRWAAFVQCRLGCKPGRHACYKNLSEYPLQIQLL